MKLLLASERIAGEFETGYPENRCISSNEYENKTKNNLIKTQCSIHVVYTKKSFFYLALLYTRKEFEKKIVVLCKRS